MKNDGTTNPKQFEEIKESIRRQQLASVAPSEPEQDDVNHQEFLKLYEKENSLHVDNSFVGKALALLLHVNTQYMIDPASPTDKEAVGHALSNMSMAIVADKPDDKSTKDRLYAIFRTDMEKLAANFRHYGILPHDRLWELVAYFQENLSQYVWGDIDG